MHIAVVAIGAYGHIIPTLSFVSELVDRDVRVTYFAPEEFRELIEPAGALFVPVRSWMAEHEAEYVQKAAEQGDDIASVVPFMFLNEADEYIDDILDVLKKDRPDAIVHDFSGIAGTIAADVLKVPNIMIYTTYPSNSGFSVSRVFETILKGHSMWTAAEQAAESLTARYGCRKMTVREIFDGHGDLNVVMIHDRLVPDAESFDDRFVFTGAQIGKRAKIGDWTIPDNGKPLLYSSFGTVFNDWPEFYPILFDAVRDLNINVIASLGSVDPTSLKDIPDNVEVAKKVPQLEVLSHASVFITHAGVGSIGEAVYYGVPMIAIPQIDEQRISAKLIQNKGLGIAFMDKHSITSSDLRTAIENLLKDSSCRDRVKEYSKDMKLLGGAKGTADAILSFLGN